MVRATNQVIHKVACTDTEEAWKLDIWDLRRREIVLFMNRRQRFWSAVQSLHLLGTGVSYKSFEKA